MLDRCDIYNHGTYHVLGQVLSIPGFENLIKDKDILHIGANHGLEADIYDLFQARKVFWFECNKLIFPDLLERIKDRPGHQAFCSALWSKAGEKLTFYFYRNKKDGASGFFEDQNMKDCVPDCPQLEETVSITTNTLDNYISDQVFPIDNISLLNIDIQGSELECFKGAEKLLMSPALKCIYCEVSRGQVYKNGPEQSDIVNYLANYNFQLVGSIEDWSGKTKDSNTEVWHGDAIFLRN